MCGGGGGGGRGGGPSSTTSITYRSQIHPLAAADDSDGSVHTHSVCAVEWNGPHYTCVHSVVCRAVRDTSAGLFSTRDVLKAAPESAIARRRRLRAERQVAALLSAEQERQGGGGGGLEEGTRRDRSEEDGGHQSLNEKPAQSRVEFVGGWWAPRCLTVVEETERLAVGDGAEVLPNLSVSAKDSITVSSRRREVQLVPVVTDTRPVVPSLVSHW